MKLTIPVAQMIAGGVVLGRLRKGIARRMPLLPTASSASGVTIVIPARNEAERIEACLISLPPVAEVIVVDDGSTDATASVATSHGARVVTAPPLPEGWVGKPWALQQGLDAATTDIVVFVDADVRFLDDAASALVDELRNADIVSLSTRLFTSSLLEQALSASMVTTLVYRFGPVGVEQTDANRVMGNGQCIAVRRNKLRDVGGFGLAAHNMTDDIALLRALARKGWRVAFLDGSQLLETKMYDSAGETWRQWPRSLPMVDATTPSQRASDTAMLWLTMGLPLARILARRATVIDRILLAQRAAISVALLGSYKRPRLGVLASPLLDLPVVARLTWTTLKPVRQWKGRQYAPPKTASR